MKTATTADLSLEEKVELALQLWAEVSEEVEKRRIPEWHRAILDERWRAHESGESRAIPFAEVKRELELMIAEHRNAR
ncbi:MAG: addiction module protein [Verrucomicrobiae bacterium]|nr:addiction module protein [Verrucomicrobiae bacterium]MCP5540140.1 addiction module protein [Akkermansiaceae bacterium]